MYMKRMTRRILQQTAPVRCMTCCTLNYRKINESGHDHKRREIN